MKRPIHIAAVLALAAALGLAGGAVARDDHGRHNGRGQSEQGDRGGGDRRGPPQRGDEGRGRWSDRGQGDRGPPGRAIEERGYGERNRWEDRGPPPGRVEPYRGDAYRRYDERPPAYAAPPAYGRYAPAPTRPGGYLPDSYRGAAVQDYPRYRLRPPPHGYAWVRTGNGFALVSEADGRVFDIVPD